MSEVFFVLRRLLQSSRSCHIFMILRNKIQSSRYKLDYYRIRLVLFSFVARVPHLRKFECVLRHILQLQKQTLNSFDSVLSQLCS